MCAGPGNKLVVPEIGAPSEGARCTRRGCQDLRERYPALQELPSRLLALVEKLDASQSNQPPQCNVSFRHKADMQIAFSDVRFRG
jgi:hypothetical protein